MAYRVRGIGHDRGERMARMAAGDRGQGPGSAEVHVRLEQPGHATVLRLDDGLRVTPSPALFGDLKHLLGPGSLVS